MNKVGLIAGGGTLPLEFIKSAKKQGDQVVVFALNQMALPEVEREADRIYWLDFGQYAKFMFLLVKERLRQIALVGKVDKSVIYKDGQLDNDSREGLESLGDRSDYSILEEATRRLAQVGVEVIDCKRYLSHLLPGKGVLGAVTPAGNVQKDIEFGFGMAKKLAEADIGQTVIVKDGAVVAVEAMEGTDATIERASSIAGKGCVMVKVSRPQQDMRWDVPTVGIRTAEMLAENGYTALAIESARMYLLDRDEFIETADASGITIQAL
ncbi:MAG: DUF1009 domain-containing protein [Candidatus Omnitrophica bacterium]|nr:DUF1009 domain-containing protein [Candidatus Omnitrophota bacterium]